MGLEHTVVNNTAKENDIILKVAEDLRRGVCEYAFESHFLGIGHNLAGIRVSVEVSTLASAILYLETGRITRFKKPSVDFLVDFEINSIPVALRGKINSMCRRGDLTYDFLELDNDGVYKTEIELYNGVTVRQVHNSALINGLVLAIIDYYQQ